METNRVRYLGPILVLVLLAVAFCSLAADSKEESVKTGLDPKLNETSDLKEQAGGSNLVSNSGEDGKGKEKGDQVNKSKEVGAAGDSNKSDTSKQFESKDNVEKGKDNSVDEFQAREGDDNKKEKSSGGDASKGLPKEKNDKGDQTVPLTKPRKEGPRVEECDPSNKCMDNEHKLVACLRVPGNDAPDLSLLIQNKGKGPLSVTISSPDYVQLEKTKIQLQEKEDQKVKVTIICGGSDNLIVLTAGNGQCKLDIRDMVAHYCGKEFDNSHRSTDIINFMSRTSTIVVLSFATLLILASAWMCMSFRKKQVSNIGTKYQSLDMELPVSGGGKTESEVNDGWDNSWGDDWDDEEAPKTPSLPVTPSRTTKGLASRRLSKEGWKD